MKSSSIQTAVMEVLERQQGHHLTAVEIYEQIRSRLPAVNPSSVYRALERLASEGNVSVSDMGTGATVYEYVNAEKHHHLVCQVCGKTMLLDEITVADFFARVETATNFEVKTNHLVLFGICPDCKGKITD